MIVARYKRSGKRVRAYVQAATNQPFGVMSYIKPSTGECVTVLRIGEVA